MQIFTHDSSFHNDPTHHESMYRLIKCYKMLKYNNINMIQCSSIKLDSIILPEFLKKFDCIFKCPLCKKSCNFCETCDTSGVSKFGTDSYITPYTADTILGCISCIYSAIDYMIETKKYTYLLIRPPGHHAGNNPSGFCFFNNAICATNYALSKGFLRIGIFDYDFHHCDGTQELMKNRNNIFLCSIHGWGDNIYPFTGSTDENTLNILNIPINLNKKDRRKITNKIYMKYVNEKVIPFFINSQIDFLIISNGLDAHKKDSLCGMNIDNNFYVEVCIELKKLELPIIFLLEGGYNGNVVSSVTKSIYDVMSC